MAKKSARKSAKKSAKGKRKPGAYALFVKDKMKNRGNKPVTVMMKTIGAEWRKLSAEEKKRWQNKAKK